MSVRIRELRINAEIRGRDSEQREKDEPAGTEVRPVRAVTRSGDGFDSALRTRKER